MGDVVVFRRRPAAEAEDEMPEIDLITAVDVAIRDLQDIGVQETLEAIRARALACRSMLERAFEAARFD